ncbi:hypothetical protein GPECTOR_11g227 [Gonium pectorale]|uniref:carotenoid 9,10-dioxygenase n=1 Tax=Gonium pectorale TaxID=33097 RepID=A0A150GPM4_GONPE|nr:hypothetical protein GPECTOR_11g227 [Gonium pectorale]|eukprot:KXZ51783.1 hypothetical protein GPECTOR_11g227 [Gonium pectorale]
MPRVDSAIPLCLGRTKQQERAAGRPLFNKLGDLYGKRGLALLLLQKLFRSLGVVRTENGAGTANTALAFHAGRLLALHEGDLPYGVRVLCNGLIETMGRMRLSSSWKTSFTAHPKIDPVNGEMLFLGYQFESNPYVSAGILDEHGNLVRQWGVELPYPVMMHDMAATENYLVLMHLPLCFDPQAMVKDNTVPFRLRRELTSRIGLLRRDQASCPAGGAEVAWFDIPGPGFMAFHVATAFEDAHGNVKVYACQQDNINLDLDAILCSEELARLTEYTLVPASGAASSRRLSSVVGDFPVVHPGKATRPCRWAWLATMETSATCNTPSFTGIAKMDLTAQPGTDACAGCIAYPAGTYGGEAVFVPRTAAAAAEDDGYLVVYVYDTLADASYFHVYDAVKMGSEPLARIRMPRRVPYGFHGTWVSEQQLKSQVMWV